MKKSVRHYLDDIVEYIDRIRLTIEGRDKSDIWVDADLQDLLLRRIEVIGEVVKRIPETFKQKHPEIPWKDIAGSRDRIAHDYDGLDYNIVWEIAVEHSVTLGKKIDALVKEIDEQII